MAIKLGVAPIAWSNDDLPELGGDTPLDVCLRESHAAGYSGTESGGKFPLDASVLGPLLSQYDLQLVSGWFSGRLLELSVAEEIQRMEQQLSTFAALGAPVMVYAETSGSVQSQRTTPLSQRPRLAPEDYPAYGAKLTAVAEHMAARGVPMAYHHHMGTIIETEAEIDTLMAHTGPAVGLLIDTGHLTFAGGDVLATTHRYGARINHVHCKDIRPDVLQRVREQDMSFLDGVLAGVFTVPGDGHIDFHAFAQTLAEIAYRGWAVVEAEQDPAQANPLQYAKLGYTHLHQALTAAGLAIAK
ncbi:MAG: myo-inosose-2 dehydratase [Gammaproteobacteria bacterium]